MIIVNVLYTLNSKNYIKIGVYFALFFSYVQMSLTAQLYVAITIYNTQYHGNNGTI